MPKKKKIIIWFKDLGIKDVALVGGKNAALGEMFGKLRKIGIAVPDGFALTAAAYNLFLEKSGLDKKIEEILKGLNTKNIKNLLSRGRAMRRAILAADLPKEIVSEVKKHYWFFERRYGKEVDVAVRSSATAEDLPGASFAGQQETYLNVHGLDGVLLAVKKCIASLFTDRAISYRADKGFGQFGVALSVGIQKMVRSDLGTSGVIFTIDTESGFDKVVVVNGSYGLGETVVQGKVVPDEFIVFKPALAKGFKAIIAKNLGEKDRKLIYSTAGTKMTTVSESAKNKFCLSDEEVLTLARWSVLIEEHFSKVHRRYTPMDIEWAKDGKTGELFIVQARPETVQALSSKKIYKEYRLKKTGRLLAQGIAVGAKIGCGQARLINDARKINDFKKDEILVTKVTDPDWEPIMKIASGIVTDEGGRTSHAAIVSRELGIPCVVGAGRATKVLKTGENLTVDCASGEVGKVYSGRLPYEVIEHRLDKIPKTKTKVTVNIGSPDEAFQNHYLPVKGVGLGRVEFIIASHIKIHPNALLDYPNLVKKSKKDIKTKRIVNQIDKIARGYKSKTRFYVDELAEGIAKIGAAFYPEEVIIRFSDFKTNEYRQLVGGELYEPLEENPMLGFRGASRYYDPKFKDAFSLECRALKKVREDMGLKNVVAMIPFCRTPEEGKKVLAIMKARGLDKNKDKTFKVYVMAEIPSNILLADEFLEIFDGMSIGSNDLTQLVLGLDRDSGIVTHIANENNPAVKKMISEVIQKCRKRGKYIGICGQAPSDYPTFAEFLVREKIGSISLNPDTVIKTILRIKKAESLTLRGSHARKII